MLYVCACVCVRSASVSDNYVKMAVICYTFSLFYFQLRSISRHTMEEEDQLDAHSEVISHEDYQPTESDINQDSVLYTASSTFPVPANIPTHCSDHYKIVPNIKCARKSPENMHEYYANIQNNHSVDNHIGYSLHRVKYEEQLQEFNEQQAVIPSRNAEQASMLSCDVNKITEVKADPVEYSRNSDETRHWVVCQGGVLKQVKAEYTLGVSLLPDEDGNVNVDEKNLNCGKSHAILEHGSQLKVDENNRTVVKPSSSDRNTKSIVKADVLKVHGMARRGVKSYTCDTCGKSFAQSSHLKDHERTHTGVKPYSCETCGKSYARSSNLKDHGRTHTGVKPYSCETCGKSYARSSNLKDHERTHSGLKPYSCETCGQSFAQPGTLTKHERTHSGLKPYTCETCGKSFAQSGTLKYHQRTHTGVKPYTCDTCGKSFAQSRTFAYHQNTHTGVKPYTCDTCGKSFAQSGTLT